MYRAIPLTIFSLVIALNYIGIKSIKLKELGANIILSTKLNSTGLMVLSCKIHQI